MDNRYRETLKTIILNPDSQILGQIRPYNAPCLHFPITLGHFLKNTSRNRTRDQGPGPGTRDQGPGPGTGTRDQGPGTRDRDQGPGTGDQGPGTKGYMQ